MPKKLFKANANVPEMPTVRFMRKAAPGSEKSFTDVTRQVARLEIETLEDGTDACALLRLDEKGELVWRTLHQSVDEARWQATHEYLIEEKDWNAC